MKAVFGFYKILSLLSIDVAGGAVVCAWFFARALGVVVRPYGFICLGLTVWIIYTSDHLMDAWRMKTTASTDRHRFHQKHFKTLAALLVVAVGFDAYVATLIKPAVFHWGLILGLTVLVYFVIQTKLKFLKEISGAILYSAGVLLPSLPVTQSPIPFGTNLLICQFAITALINLILFSWFDYHHDASDGRTSLVTIVGYSSGKKILVGLFIVQLVLLGILMIYSSDVIAWVIMAAMNIVLLLIFFSHHHFAVADRYRYAGDAIFFIPLLYMIIT